MTKVARNAEEKQRDQNMKLIPMMVVAAMMVWVAGCNDDTKTSGAAPAGSGTKMENAPAAQGSATKDDGSGTKPAAPAGSGSKSEGSGSK